MRKTFTIIILTIACTLQAKAQTDYAKPTNWFRSGKYDKQIDVLFFAPTSVTDKDCNGQHHLDTSSEKQRQAMDVWLRFAAGLFGESCNYYGVYYSQMTMESFSSSEFNIRLQKTMTDVRNAFNYYIKHINNGRPFILAGHSQGALCIYNLLQSKEMTDEIFERMIVAYTIGYRISPQVADKCKYIVAARGAGDIGVCVSYNTASNDITSSPHITALNINPLNWRRDSRKAPADMHLGGVDIDEKGMITREFKGVLSAKAESEKGFVIVEGVNPQDYYKPYLGQIWFRYGNYHLQDLTFFYRNIQQNIRDRIAAYKLKLRLRNSRFSVQKSDVKST